MTSRTPSALELYQAALCEFQRAGAHAALATLGEVAARADVLTTLKDGDTDAVYPGTTITRGARAEACKGDFGDIVDVRFSAGGRATVASESWTRGSPARGVWTGRIDVALGTVASLAGEGSAAAALYPNGALHLTGECVAQLSVGNRTANVGELLIVRVSELPTLLESKRIGDRTFLLVACAPGYGIELDTRFDIAPALLTTGILTSFLIEVHARGPDAAVVGLAHGVSATFEPSPRIVRGDNTPFGFGLYDVAHVLRIDRKHVSHVLTARLASEASWIVANGGGLFVEAKSDELSIIDDGGNTSLECSPHVTRAAVPVAGAIAEPFELAPHTRLAFHLTPPRKRAANTIGILLGKDEITIDPIQNAEITVLRTRDFMALRFAFVNYDVVYDVADSPYLKRRTQQGLVIAIFPPQMVAEAAMEAAPPALGIGSRLPCESRLVFRETRDVVPLTLDELLAFPKGAAVLRTATNGEIAPGPPKLTNDVQAETALELPYRMFIAPVAGSEWRASSPVEGERQPLWRVSITGSRAVHTLWSPDWSAKASARRSKAKTASPADEVGSSLGPVYRNMIVKAGSKAPLRVEQLDLTSLGVWMRVDQRWRSSGSALLAWVHQIDQGREKLVIVARKGFSFPWGHRINCISLTERRRAKLPDERFTSYLQKRCFLVFEEQIKDYDTWDFPFTSIDLGSEASPDLYQCDETKPFWAMHDATRHVEFPLAALDHQGQPCAFTAPMAFVPADANQEAVDDLVAEYSAAVAGSTQTQLFRSTRSLGNQLVSVVKPLSGVSTRLECNQMRFAALRLPDEWKAGVRESPPFRPVAAHYQISIPELGNIVRRPDAGTPAVPRGWFKPVEYTGPTAKDVFSAICDATECGEPNQFNMDFRKFGLDKIGGIGAPSFDLSALSRTLGTLGADIRGTANEFKIANFFKDARLFGFDLADLLGNVMVKMGELPKLARQQLPDFDKIEYCWTNSSFATSSIFKPHQSGRTELKLCTEIKVPRTLQPPDVLTSGKLTNFAVNLGLITLEFAEVSFMNRNGDKPSVKPVIREVQFDGVLGFVGRLARELKLGGDGPINFKVRVSLAELQALLRIKLPRIAVGVFSLQNLALTTVVTLPFVGDKLEPNFEFGFAERNNPFLLTIAIFGGGGFFRLVTAPSGLRELEIALEFGGAAAIDAGVSGGRISVMGGIYYGWRNDDVTAEGYLRCNGCAYVLGLTVSLEFGMALTWTKSLKGFAGRAWLYIKIELFFFEVEVKFSVERRFGGASSLLLGTETAAETPVLLADIFPDARSWTEYWDAFR